MLFETSRGEKTREDSNDDGRKKRWRRCLFFFFLRLPAADQDFSFFVSLFFFFLSFFIWKKLNLFSFLFLSHSIPRAGPILLEDYHLVEKLANVSKIVLLILMFS